MSESVSESVSQSVGLGETKRVRPSVSQRQLKLRTERSSDPSDRNRRRSRICSPGPAQSRSCKRALPRFCGDRPSRSIAGFEENRPSDAPPARFMMVFHVLHLGVFSSVCSSVPFVEFSNRTIGFGAGGEGTKEEGKKKRRKNV